jgi:hypothetical protein
VSKQKGEKNNKKKKKKKKDRLSTATKKSLLYSLNNPLGPSQSASRHVKAVTEAFQPRKPKKGKKRKKKSKKEHNTQTNAGDQQSVFGEKEKQNKAPYTSTNDEFFFFAKNF